MWRAVAATALPLASRDLAGKHVAMAMLSFAVFAHAGDAAPRPTVPADVRADVDAIAKHLTQVNDAGPALACGKAANYARYGAETMRDAGEANLRAGRMTQPAYDAMAPGLRSLLGVLSARECKSATGTRRDFYRCVSSEHNHVLACGKAHPFEP